MPDRPLNKEEKEIYLKIATQIHGILKQFQCVDVHERNRHAANVIYFIGDLNKGKFDQSTAFAAGGFTRVQLARDWLIDTMHDQLVKGKG